jgi:hypothetical protein
MMRNRTIGAIFALLIALHAPLGAAQPASRTFPTAEAAAAALYDAVRSNDEGAVTQILGAPNELVSAEEPGDDLRDRQQFVRKFQQMHRLAGERDHPTVLYIGAENWPFPYPLVQQGSVWHFDAKAGTQEVLARRIGENELAAIAAGRQLVVNVGNDGGAAPFHGYYFRRLPGQQKLLAFPAQYRVTGVMTLLVDADGAVYEKDLGPDTTQRAKKLKKLNSTSSWHRVE